MSQYLPTGNFRWMTNKEISKIELGKYKADGKKRFILEVDLEYPQELHDLHNDYTVCPEKVKASNDMLSGYCKEIADKFNISIGLISKLIPTLRDKKEYIKKSDDNYPREAMHIWTENRPVDSHNKEVLDLINEELVTITAHDVYLKNVCDVDINNTGEIHYHIENKTNGGKQNELSAESNQFEKKIKSGNK